MQSLASYGSDSEEDHSPVASTSALPTQPTAAAAPVPAPAGLNRLRAPPPSAQPPKANSSLTGVRLSAPAPSSTSSSAQPPYQAPRPRSKSPPPYVRSPAPPEPRALAGSHAEPNTARDGGGLSIRGAAEAAKGEEGGGLEFGLRKGSLEEFGVPPVPTELDRVAPSVQAKIDNFHRLATTRGLHFNDNLAASKAFRNPRIHAKLVQFIDLGDAGECRSNWDSAVWSPFGLPTDATAAKIAELQHSLSTARQSAQSSASGRTSVAFTSSTAASTAPGRDAALRVRDSLARQPKDKDKNERSHPSDGPRDRDRDRDGVGAKRGRWDKTGGGRDRSRSPRR